jgi:putative oxidoreductase
MNSTALRPYGALLLRLTLGLAFLAHSVYLKVFVFTMDGTVRFFESLGLPGVLAWVVLLVEAAAGIALILGFHARLAALAAFPLLLGATWAHWGSGWMFANTGGGWEYPAFWASALLVQAMIGGGAHALADDEAAS